MLWGPGPKSRNISRLEADMRIIINKSLLCSPHVPLKVVRGGKEINPSWATDLVAHIHNAFAYNSKGDLCWRESQLPPALQVIVRKHDLVFKED